MIRDARKINEGEVLSCDICIVGAGAAGITLALELSQSGRRVILLEAGDLRGPAGSDKLYQGKAEPQTKHLTPDEDRHRMVGGTSAKWGGRCIPYDSIDFEARAHVPFSGWPVAREDLLSYYEEAVKWCECGPFEFSAGGAMTAAAGEMFSGFKSERVTSDSLERWSPPTHFGKAYRDRLRSQQNLTVLTRAVAIELLTDSSGKSVDKLSVATLAGGQFTISAGTFVLAGGGLEVTRLLLNSKDQGGKCLGDHSNWLGRGYMCHIHGTIAKLILNEGKDVVFGYEADDHGVFCRRRLCVSETAQRELGLLNMYALLDRPLVSDPEHGDATLSAAYLAKRLLQRHTKDGTRSGNLYVKHVLNILAGSPTLVTHLPKFGRDRFLHKRRMPSLLVRPRGNTYYLYFHAEQAPNRDSRVMLSNEVDELQVPRLRINFQITDLDVDSVYRSHALIDEELQASGVGRLEFLSEDPESEIRKASAVLGHHIGTTRMSERPEDGVVDKNARLHHVKNVYVASSAVFPTSSQAHPTLTIVAMALRLARQLQSTRQT